MIKNVLNLLYNIPFLPHSISKLLSVLNDPAANLSDLVTIVEEDPALAMQALHLCNSAYYSLPVEVTSIVHATRLLGTETVAGLAMAAYFQGLMKQKSAPVKNPWLKGAREHILKTAQFSEFLARQVDRGLSPSTAFTAGLLHDSGKLIFSKLPSTYATKVQNLIDEEGVKLFEAEKEILGIDHAEAGYHLAKRWQMPKIIMDVIRYHHDPFLSEFEQTFYVYLSDTIVHLINNEQDISALSDSIQALDVLHEVGLEREQLTTLAQRWIEKNQI